MKLVEFPLTTDYHPIEDRTENRCKVTVVAQILKKQVCSFQIETGSQALQDVKPVAEESKDKRKVCFRSKIGHKNSFAVSSCFARGNGGNREARGGKTEPTTASTGVWLEKDGHHLKHNESRWTSSK